MKSFIFSFVSSIIIMLIMSISMMSVMVESFQLTRTTASVSSNVIFASMKSIKTNNNPVTATILLSSPLSPTTTIANTKSYQNRHRNTLSMSSSSENNNDPTGTKSNNLPMLLDPGTKGGALFLSLVLFIIPIIIYEVVTIGFGVDGVEAGKWIGVGFTFFTTVLWVSTYIFRVATKDMTYAKQLKDYENAVIAKRLEELDDDEIQALVEDIERDDF